MPTYGNATFFLNLVDKMTKTYPLWICPSKDNYHSDKIFSTRKKELCEDNMIIDVGIYGIKNTTIDNINNSSYSGHNH